MVDTWTAKALLGYIEAHEGYCVQLGAADSGARAPVNMSGSVGSR